MSCTNPNSLTVTTLRPQVLLVFKEPMDRRTVSHKLEVILHNLTDAVSVKDTLDDLVDDKLVAITWNAQSTELTIEVRKVVRALEDGKSYLLIIGVVSGECVKTVVGTQVCTGTVGPFLFTVDVP